MEWSSLSFFFSLSLSSNHATKHLFVETAIRRTHSNVTWWSDFLRRFSKRGLSARAVDTDRQVSGSHTCGIARVRARGPWLSWVPRLIWVSHTPSESITSRALGTHAVNVSTLGPPAVVERRAPRIRGARFRFKDNYSSHLSHVSDLRYAVGQNARRDRARREKKKKKEKKREKRRQHWKRGERDRFVTVRILSWLG